MPPSPTTALRRGLTYPRPYVAFAFQAFERRVHGTDCDLAPRPRFDLASDSCAVGIAAQPHERQENELLEFAERRNHKTHIVHNVDYISRGRFVGTRCEDKVRCRKACAAPVLVRIRVLGCEARGDSRKFCARLFDGDIGLQQAEGAAEPPVAALGAGGAQSERIPDLRTAAIEALSRGSTPTTVYGTP